MSCTVPSNQPIYQALIDKAAKYSAVKYLQKDANKYTKAANAILKSHINLYSIAQQSTNIWNFEEDFDDEYEEDLPHISSSIKQFIFDYIKEHN